MPSIVPLYSVYRPESLVDTERELSVFHTLPTWAVIRRYRPMVVLVRESGRDVALFAKQRNVDLIILEGEWDEARSGYMFKKERGVAERAECTVVVAIPPAS